MENQIAGMERIRHTAQMMMENLGKDFPFSISVFVDGAIMEVGFVDLPEIGQQE